MNNCIRNKKSTKNQISKTNTIINVMTEETLNLVNQNSVRRVNNKSLLERGNKKKKKKKIKESSSDNDGQYQKMKIKSKQEDQKANKKIYFQKEKNIKAQFSSSQSQKKDYKTRPNKYYEQYGSKSRQYKKQIQQNNQTQQRKQKYARDYQAEYQQKRIKQRAQEQKYIKKNYYSKNERPKDQKRSEYKNQYSQNKNFKSKGKFNQNSTKYKIQERQIKYSKTQFKQDQEIQTKYKQKQQRKFVRPKNKFKVPKVPKVKVRNKQEIRKQIKDRLGRVMQKMLGDPEEPLVEQQIQLIRNRLTTNNQRYYQFLKESMSKLPDLEDQASLSRLLSKVNAIQHKITTTLPIIEYAQQIKQSVLANPITLLVGETGSGKSTQIAQLLHQILVQNGQSGKIAVIQPRKLAVKSLATRVAYQMCVQLGSLVGYQAGAQQSTSEQTNIVFVLDRIFISKLADNKQASKQLQNLRFLIIDQAHQRKINTDVLLAKSKQLVKQHPNLRVVITTATMNQQLLQEYFGIQKVLKIPGRRFPVQIIYKSCQNQNIQKTCIKLIESVMVDKKTEGHLLVFCQSVQQINTLISKAQPLFPQNKFLLLPLHGNLKPEQSNMVFKETSHRKIIFATRMAQTSLTIPGVAVVVDLGLDIQTIYYPQQRLSKFEKVEITKAAADQRAGRTGRTGNGICYRLYSEEKYMSKQLHKSPEVLRCCIDSLVLKLLDLGVRDVINFDYVTKPELASLKNSLHFLRVLGAVDEHQRILLVGRMMSRFPTQPFFTRAIIEAHMVNDIKLNSSLLDDVCYIMSMISITQRVFHCPEENRQLVNSIKLKNFYDGDGDFFTLLQIYKQLEQFPKWGERNKYCQKNSINYKCFNECRDILKQLHFSIRKNMDLLKDIVLEEKGSYYSEEQKHVIMNESHRDSVLRCLACSLVQNLCVYSDNSCLGYTLVSRRMQVHIYGTSILDIIQERPKYILAYNLVNTKAGKSCWKYCQRITQQQITKFVKKQTLSLLGIQDMAIRHPVFQEKVFDDVPSIVAKGIDKQFGTTVKFLFVDKRNHKIRLFLPQSEPGFEDIVSMVQQQIDKRKAYMSTQVNLFQKNALIKVSLGPGVVCVGICQELPFSSITIECREKDQARLKGVEQILKSVLLHCKVSKIGNRIILEADGEAGKKKLSEWYSILMRMKALDQSSLTKTKAAKNYRRQLDQSKNEYGQYSPQVAKQITLRMLGQQQLNRVLSLMVEINTINEQQFQILAQGLSYCAITNSLPSKAKHSLYARITYFNGTKVVQPGKRVRAFIKSTKSYNQDWAALDYELIQKNQKQYTQEESLFFNKFKITKCRRFLLFEIEGVASDQVALERKINQVCAQVSQRLGLKFLFFLGFQISLRRNGPKHFSQKNQTAKLTKLLNNHQINYMINGFASKYGKVSAELELFSQSQAQVLQKLNEAEGLLGLQKLYVVLNYQYQIKVQPEVFQVYSGSFSKLTKQLEGSFRGLLIQYRNGKHDTCLRISCSNEHIMLQACAALSRLFEGEVCDFKLSQTLINSLGQSKIRKKILQYQKSIDVEMNLQHSDYTFSYDSRKRKILLFCEPHLRQDIKARFEKLLRADFEQKVEIPFSGRSIRGVLENNFMEQVRTKQVDIEINLVHKKIQLCGRLQQLEHCRSLVEEKLQERSSSFECSICYSSGTDSFRLLNCDHQFCVLCLKNVVYAASNDRSKLPVCCPQESCKKPLAIKQIAHLIQTHQFYQLLQLATNTYIDQNPAKFVICPVNHCQSLLLKQPDSKAVQCLYCQFKFCPNCRYEQHPMVSCDQFKKMMVELPKGCKLCPKCENPILKAGGCNHITCPTCSSHFCWECLQICTEKDIYKHLSEMHGGFGIDPAEPVEIH